MVLSSGPIIMTNPEIVSLKYATINYGGQRLISRAEVLGAAHSERGVLALQDCTYPQDLASLYYYVMNLWTPIDDCRTVFLPTIIWCLYAALIKLIASFSEQFLKQSMTSISKGCRMFNMRSESSYVYSSVQ